MAKTAINTLKEWFKTGKYPTQTQFWNWLDSFWHKDEVIPTSQIQNLETLLDSKANVDALNNKADLGEDGKVLPEQLPIQSPEENRLISGGISWTGENYDYHVNTVYLVDGIIHNIENETISLNSSDDNYNRFDIVIGNTDGTVAPVQGIAEENPVIPNINDNQVLLGVVFVAAQSTEPLPDNIDLVYNENNATIEWNASANTTVGNVLFDYDTNPFKGTKCIHAEINVYEDIIFDKGAIFNLLDYQNVVVRVRLYSGVVYDTNLSIQILRPNGTLAHSSYVSLNKWGINRNVRDVWQTAIIPVSAFQVLNLSGAYSKFRIRNTSSLTTNENIRIFDLDFILLEKAIIVPEKNYTINIERDGSAIGSAKTLNFKGNVEVEQVGDKIEVSVENSSSTTPSVVRFLKDESLTEEHIGLLAMQQVTALVEEPQTVEDFEVKAVLANTIPAIEGIKGEYLLRLSGVLMEHPTTDIWRITFVNNPSNGDDIVFSFEGFSQTIYFDTENNWEEFKIKSELTIAGTIANLISFFNEDTSLLSQQYIRIVNTDTDINDNPYVDFELYYNCPDNDKYLPKTFGIGSTNYSFSGEPVQMKKADIAAKAKYISENPSGFYMQISNWDTGNVYEYIIGLNELFITNSKGTVGAFGIKYFASENEALDAINEAIVNTNNNALHTYFDVLSPLVYNNEDNCFEITIRSKTAPKYNFPFIVQDNPVVGHIDFSELIQPSLSDFEKIPYTILGKIIGIENNEVLIDTNSITTLIMCSSEDGALSAIPASVGMDNIGFWLIAWRNGKVIDWWGYYMLMLSAGFASDAAFTFPFGIGGVFRPLSVAGPDESVIVDNKVFFD